MDHILIESLLHEDESPTLDFKRGQYSFSRANSDAKGELLKDILSFANAWRRETAYVLIGVEEVKGGRSIVVGVNTHLDDAHLHQFVNSKTQIPIDFSYSLFQTKTAEIGVIEIPVQRHRPIYLTQRYGRLDASTVYRRDGSSTTIASPDEIARMGEARNVQATPHLAIEWADIDRKAPLSDSCSVCSLDLVPRLPDGTFRRQSGLYDAYPDDMDDRLYSRLLIDFTYSMALLRPVGLHVHNQSDTVARRVRFVGSIARSDGIRVRDWSNRPSRRHYDVNPPLPLTYSVRGDPDPVVEKLAERYEISVDFGDVRPHDDIFTTSPILVGSSAAGVATLTGEFRADNLRKPLSCRLTISFEVSRRSMEIKDVDHYMNNGYD